jgi:hypothetical protein
LLMSWRIAVSVPDVPDAVRTPKASVCDPLFRLSPCSVSRHALAVACRRIGASLPLHAAVLPLARLRRPSQPRPWIPAQRLVSKAEQPQTYPSFSMPRLQGVVLAADVLHDLLPQTACASDRGGLGTRGVLSSPADRTVAALRQDLGHSDGRALGTARDPLSCSMP